MPAKVPGEHPYDDDTTDLEPPDATLIQAVRRGDVEAAAELFRRHRPAAIRFASSNASHTHVEDIVSEAFERVFAALYQGGGPEAFRPYLFTTIRRVRVDLHRKHGREVAHTRVSEVNSEAPPRELIAPDTAGATLDAEIVRRAFLSLPERWRLVLWYTAVESRTLEETAELIDGNPNSVAVLSFRAREGLRNAYLAQHVALDRTGAHKEVLELLPRWVRGGLTPSKQALVERHLDGCVSCAAVAAELASINTNLGAAIGPALLGLTAPVLVRGFLAQHHLARLLLVAAGLLGSAVTVAVLVWPSGHADRAPAPVPTAAPSVRSAPTLQARPTPAATRHQHVPVAPLPDAGSLDPAAPATRSPSPSPRPFTPAPSPTATAAAPVDVGLGGYASEPIEGSPWQHVEVPVTGAVAGPGTALQLDVVLHAVANQRVHQDHDFGAWTCIRSTSRSTSQGDVRLTCLLPAGAEPRTLGIDVLPAGQQPRITLAIRPLGVPDPDPSDNRISILLPVT
ncbi:MAG: sigma-70 family RNA polymerase sigma factor [Nocardioidaceae bacterium]|nr:sigma-70 family RNA polymerase sigma factor [Nocardioidaceae bacterium]